MLPSTKRLSRQEFSNLLASKPTRMVFNSLGTMKYTEGQQKKASVVVSSKNERLSVKRNKLRRRIYNFFVTYFKNNPTSGGYIIYTSKQASSFGFEETKRLFYELLEKTTK